jgi:hypothetical protein
MTETTPNTEEKTRAPRTSEVIILRGYQPEEPGADFLQPGVKISLPEREAKTIIRLGIATFPED